MAAASSVCKYYNLEGCDGHCRDIATQTPWLESQARLGEVDQVEQLSLADGESDLAGLLEGQLGACLDTEPGDGEVLALQRVTAAARAVQQLLMEHFGQPRWAAMVGPVAGPQLDVHLDLAKANA